MRKGGDRKGDYRQTAAEIGSIGQGEDDQMERERENGSGSDTQVNVCETPFRDQLCKLTDHEEQWLKSKSIQYTSQKRSIDND